MRRRVTVFVALAAALALTAQPAVAQTPSADGDDRVTGNTYVRHDGGTDRAIAHCNNAATNPAGDNDPNDADADSNDGGTRRQANEPFSVPDPTDPNTIAAGWNDYCTTDLGAGWQGLAYSRDRGETWTDSLIPGYPHDTSAEGRASPLFGTHTDAGDPVAGFDRAGNLFVGGIAFNRTKPSNGDVWVATYSTNPHPSGFPWDYQRTRIVGQGTPSSTQGGIFQDKVMLEVDRTGGRFDGNVYVCWTRFTGVAGQNKIYFSRSTNKGVTFSKPLAITSHGETGSVQGCDIAIERDGDVYVSFRTYNDNASKTTSGIGLTRSANGGATFERARIIRAVQFYSPNDGDRNCGDGPVHCPSDFVFHRYPEFVRATADQSGELPGVFLSYPGIRPTSVANSTSSYSSAGAGRVGQGLTYVIRSTNDGRTWTAGQAVDPHPVGHQYFADLDALNGTLAVMWQDSRTDPAYSVQRPPGNTRDAQGRAISSGRNVINTFFSYSTNGTSFAPSTKVSSQAHQSQYEMFSNRDLPFQGDYNWIQLAATSGGGLLAYMTWTDNRDVVEGVDPREAEATPGFNDGFDVAQCRTDLGAGDPPATGIPMFRRDAPYTGDECGNAGGLDQNIYGTSVTFP